MSSAASAPLSALYAIGNYYKTSRQRSQATTITTTTATATTKDLSVFPMFYDADFHVTLTDKLVPHLVGVVGVVVFVVDVVVVAFRAFIFIFNFHG